QAEDGIRDFHVTGVQTCALPISLAVTMCDHLNLPLAEGHTERFPDGEIIVKVNEDVRGRDCFVVQSTCDPVNENLMELLIYIDRSEERRVGKEGRSVCAWP